MRISRTVRANVLMNCGYTTGWIKWKKNKSVFPSNFWLMGCQYNSFTLINYEHTIEEFGKAMNEKNLKKTLFP